MASSPPGRARLGSTGTGDVIIRVSLRALNRAFPQVRYYAFGRQERVAVYLEKTPESVVAMFGASRAGLGKSSDEIRQAVAASVAFDIDLQHCSNCGSGELKIPL